MAIRKPGAAGESWTVRTWNSLQSLEHSPKGMIGESIEHSSTSCVMSAVFMGERPCLSQLSLGICTLQLTFLVASIIGNLNHKHCMIDANDELRLIIFCDTDQLA